VATQAKPMRAFYASQQNSSCSYPAEVVDNPVENRIVTLCSESAQVGNRLRARQLVRPRPPQSICNPHRYAARKPLMHMHFPDFSTDGACLC
jgi:hypothetical protein